MLLLKIAAVAFIFLNLIVSAILAKLWRFKRFGLKFSDLAFPLFALEFYLISDRFFYHSALPELVLALSLLAIGTAVYFLRKKRDFLYTKFLKYFWRSGFLLMLVLYLALVITVLFFR